MDDLQASRLIKQAQLAHGDDVSVFLKRKGMFGILKIINCLQVFLLFI
jgi:hypothetical protein